MISYFDNTKNAIVVKDLPSTNVGNFTPMTTHVPLSINGPLRDRIIRFMDTHPISDPIHIAIG